MTLHRGYDLPNAQRKSGNIPVISSSGISGTHSIAKLSGENVITGRYGTIGEVFYHDGPCWPLNTTLYVENFYGNDPRYVAYLLEAMLAAMQIDGTDKSTVPGVDRNVLHDLTVPYINDLMRQKEITSILAAIDDKVANNEKLMSELEATSRLIYDYWFTQFDFPDEAGNPYRSSGGKMVWSDELKRNIPERWDVCSLGDLITFDRGFSYSSANLCGDDGVPMISLASIDRQHRYRPDELKYIDMMPGDKECVAPGDMLVACTDLTRLAEIVGCPILAPKTHKRFAYSMDLAKLHFDEQKVRKYYLFMTMRTDVYHHHIKQFASGTNVLHLDLAGFNWYKVALPPAKLQLVFDSILHPIWESIDKALRENLRLNLLRNWLLPMLMNGQATIGE